MIYNPPMRFIFIFTFLIYLSASFSQTPKPTADTTKKVSAHSPNKAMIFSVCMPGLGQTYNKKYWKIPIAYAAMGTTIYLFSTNNKLYKEYKQAYINKTDTLSSTIDLYPSYSESDLRTLSGVYRRYRDLNVILTALFYTLNIVDAYVDAQFITFDVSDDLSLHFSPALNFYSLKQKPAAGLTLSLTF